MELCDLCRNFSCRTTTIEARYHSFELECLVAVYAIKRFHIYLSGIPFTIVTDCDSFRLTLSKQTVNPRIYGWVLLLQNYVFLKLNIVQATYVSR